MPARETGVAGLLDDQTSDLHRLGARDLDSQLQASAAVNVALTRRLDDLRNPVESAGVVLVENEADDDRGDQAEGDQTQEARRCAGGHRANACEQFCRTDPSCTATGAEAAIRKWIRCSERPAIACLPRL